jgi:hypothetical protein
MRKQLCGLSALAVMAIGMVGFAQQRAQNPQGPEPKSVTLLFREDFKSGVPNDLPMTGDLLTNPNLELKLYGPGAQAGKDPLTGLRLDNEEDAANPGHITSYVWSGVTSGSWAVLLKEKNNYLDLRGPAHVLWRVRPRGLHVMHPVVKLADGEMFVADYGEPSSTYWRESEFYLADITRWRALNPTTVAEAQRKAGEPIWRDTIDLGKVDEIGFSDLMGGAGHNSQGNSGVDWIEVYGNPVKR